MKTMLKIALLMLLGSLTLLNAGDKGWYFAPKCLNINDEGFYSPNDLITKTGCKAVAGEKKYLITTNKLGALQYKCFVNGKETYFLVVHTTYDECKKYLSKR